MIGAIGAALMVATGGRALAAVEITIDKNTQRMTVAVDGTPRYNWPVSSGVPSHETPNGTFRAFRMEADHFSKEWDDAPMPHSIFFTKIGHAIHGTDSVSRLGTPASHGCVRLSRQNAATLYALVEQQGVLNTTVTLTGSAEVALAHGLRGNTAVARGDGAIGSPLQLTPRRLDSSYDTQAATDDSDTAADVYSADPYGRQVNRNPGYADRRIYQPRPQYQYNDSDTYAQQQYNGQPTYQQPRQQYYYYNQ